MNYANPVLNIINNPKLEHLYNTSFKIQIDCLMEFILRSIHFDESQSFKFSTHEQVFSNSFLFSNFIQNKKLKMEIV